MYGDVIMISKKIILFAVFFISLVAISTVGAADNATDDLASVESGSEVNEIQTATEDDLKTSLDDGRAIQENDLSGDDKLSHAEGMNVLGDELVNTKFLTLSKNRTYTVPDILNSNVTIELALCDSNYAFLDNKTVTVEFGGDSKNITSNLGFCKYQILKTEPGTYNLTMKFAGDETYNATEGKVTVVISLAETQIIAANNSVYKLKSVLENSAIYNISLTAPDSNLRYLSNKTVHVTFNGKTENFTTDELGRVRYVISNVSSGNHTIEIAFKGVEGYLPCNVTNNIEIVDVKTKLYAINDTAYPRSLVLDNLGFYPILLANVDGIIPIPLANRTVYITFNHGNRENFTTNAVGLINYILPNVTADNYTIEIEFEGADEYAPCNVTETVEIVDVGTKISALGNVTYSRPIVIGGLGYYPLLLTTNGTVPIPLGNKTVYITFGDGDCENFTTNILGLINYVLPDVGAGNYTIKIEFEGADGYVASSVTKNVEIANVKTKIILPSNADYKRPDVLNGNAVYKIILATDTIIPLPLEYKRAFITFNGTRQRYIADDRGVINFVIPDVPAGNYTIEIEFKGSTGYEAVSATGNVEISDVKTTITAATNMEYKRSAVLDGDAKYLILLTSDGIIPLPLANKTVYVAFDGKGDNYTTNALGLINYVIPENAASGVHTIDMVFEEADGYLTSRAIRNLTIVDAETKITSLNSISYSYSTVMKGNAIYPILLTTTGLIPSLLAHKTVYIEIDGKRTNFTTNAVGLINYIVNASAGEHTLNIIFAGEGGYAPCNKTASITIRKVPSTIAIDVSEISFDYNDIGTCNVSYIGASNVTAKVIDHPNAVVTVKDNIISVSALDVGTYTLVITAIPDENHTEASLAAKVTVNKAKTQLVANGITTTYKTNKNLVITLKDNQGNPISGAKVIVNLKGEKTFTTNNNGQVKVATKGLVPKTYTATITYNGDNNLLKATKSVKVVVKKAKSKITAKKKIFKAAVKTKKYTVTLKDNKRKAIKKAKLTLKVNGKTYKAKTNKKGKATFKIKKLTKSGKYKATIKFAGNKLYRQASKKVKIVVK